MSAEGRPALAGRVTATAAALASIHARRRSQPPRRCSLVAPVPRLPCSPSGAAWDAQSVGVLMQLARALPSLEVELERCGSLGCPPCPPPGHTDSAAL